MRVRAVRVFASSVRVFVACVCTQVSRHGPVLQTHFQAKSRRHLPAPWLWPAAPYNPLSCCSPAITLTCRRFHHLYYSEASLWRSYRVAPPEGFSSLAPADQEAWAAAQASRLARVAPLVADVSLVGSQCQLAPFVEVLQPDSLRGLALEWAAPHTVDVRPEHAGCGAFVAAALQRFPVLTGLELSYCPEEAGAAIPAALRSLPALRRLALRLCDVPGELAACAAQLQHLSFLRLAAGGPLPAEPALLQLTRLQHLVHLELADNRFMPGEYPPLPLPAPAECGALLTYDFTCHRGTGLYQVCACMLQTSKAGLKLSFLK